MKNMRTFSFLLLLTSNWIFGQLSYSEYRNLRNEDSFSPKRNFTSNTNWAFRGENFSKNYVNGDFTPNEVNDESINVTLNLDFQDQDYIAPWVIYIVNETGYLNFAFYEGSNQMTVNLPLGQYEFFAEFRDMSNRSVYVVKEQVEITEPKTIDFTPSESTNQFTFKIVDQGGNELNPGEYYASTNAYSQMIFERYFMFVPSQQGLGLSSFMTDNPWGGNEPIWDFFINDVSDRFAAYNSTIASKFEHLNYFVMFDKITQFTESQDLQNSPDEFFYHEQKFQPSILGQNTTKYYGFSTETSLSEDLLIGGWSLTPNITIDVANPFQAFVTRYRNEEGHGMMIFPHLAEYVTILDPNYGPEPFSIKGTSVYANPQGEVLYGTDHLGYNHVALGSKYYLDAIGYVHGLPHHPKFSFSKNDHSSLVYGKSVPILVTGTFLSENISQQQMKANFKGLHNEFRESDLFATQVQVKQNNSEVFNGGYIDFISFNLPTSGQLEINFSNENTSIGGLVGKNNTSITYNAELNNEPPTLQMLQFRKGNDFVTNQFQTGDEASVRIAAADFDYVANDDWSGEFQYVEGNSVEIFYSLRNQDSWTELALTEDPDYFQLPAFGNYYEASLAGITAEGNDVWYDVKVISTDAAGNKQTQTISPAFQLNSTLNTEDLNLSQNLLVYPNPFSVNLYYEIPEEISSNYRLILTDFSGKEILSQLRKSKDLKKVDLSNLSKGIYIFSIEVNGKIISKKVIKK